MYDNTRVHALGSSPRLRGTLTGGIERIDWSGIIPALAGNIKPPQYDLNCCWDHPRACGEHINCETHFYRILGSSPRLRGTLPE